MNIFRKLTEKNTPPPVPRHDRSDYDAIIIGAGHNGLICGAYLAQAGMHVLIVEARDDIGGMLCGENIDGDVRVPLGAHYMPPLHPTILRDLNLKKHGFKMAKADLATVAPDGEGNIVRLSSELWQTQASIRSQSSLDAEAYPAFTEEMVRLAGALSEILIRQPVHLDELSREIPWAQEILRLGHAGSDELLRLVFSGAGDVMDTFFEGALLKGMLTFDALLGNGLGPREMGSMFQYLVRHAQNGVGTTETIMVPEGGMEAFAECLGRAVEAAGAAIRVGAPVRKIRLAEGEVCGVELESGEPIDAPIIISNLDPKTTFLNLIGPRELDVGFVKDLTHLRCEGNVAKVSLVLDDLPAFTGCATEDLSERLVLCPAIDYAERAYRAMKKGEFGHDLVMEIMFPSQMITDLAPEGQHILSANINYIPFEPKGGWEEGKEALADRTLETLSYFAPGIRDLIIGGEMLTPPEMAKLFGSSGGHWHHVEPSLDQSAMVRPLASLAQYETPLQGLFLCGAGSHPGGGVTGLPGYNAAQHVKHHDLFKGGQ